MESKSKLGELSEKLHIGLDLAYKRMLTDKAKERLLLSVLLII